MTSVLIGCSGKKGNNLNENVALFVSSSDEIVGYGYINLVAIKGKSQLSKVPTIGEFVNKEMESIENSLKLTDKVHYALEGPLNKDGMPKFAYVFLTVENQDSTLQMFEKMGFFFEKEKNLMVSYDMNIAVGFNDHIAVMVSGNFGDDPKDKLMSAFASFNNKEKNESVVAILGLTTDILLAGNLENLYKTSNTSLKNLEETDQVEIAEMVNDGHFYLTVDFNNGDLTAKLNFSRVNDKMKENTFFKSKVAEDVLNNIGPGEPILVMAMSLDVEKLEKIMNEFSPNAEKSLYNTMGPMGSMFASLTGEKLSNILNGDMGIMINNSAKEDTLMKVNHLPNSHLYIGLGKSPQNMKDLIETFAREEVISDLGDGYYKIDQSIMLMKDKSIVLHSNDTLKSSFKSGKIQSVDGMNDFGSKPFSLFVDLKKLIDSDVNTTRGQYDVILGISDYMTVTGDNEEIVIKLVLKNQNENVLKQVIDVYKEELQMRMGNISF